MLFLIIAAILLIIAIILFAKHFHTYAIVLIIFAAIAALYGLMNTTASNPLLH